MTILLNAYHYADDLSTESKDSSIQKKCKNLTEEIMNNHNILLIESNKRNGKNVFGIPPKYIEAPYLEIPKIEKFIKFLNEAEKNNSLVQNGVTI